MAAEGCFTTSQTQSQSRFAFRVGLGAVDTAVCEMLRHVLGVGYLAPFSRRKPHYDDEVAFVVTRLRDLVEVVVPFMDAHLPASHKRVQYEAWRSDLLSYWELQARRRRTCRLGGCTTLARAHGLCRAHLWTEMRC